MKLSLCKLYYFDHPQVVLPINYVKTIVLGTQINCFPLHIKFKVHGSSIMKFPDWVQVKEKTLYYCTSSDVNDLKLTQPQSSYKSVSHIRAFMCTKTGYNYLGVRNNQKQNRLNSEHSELFPWLSSKRHMLISRQWDLIITCSLDRSRLLFSRRN